MRVPLDRVGENMDSLDDKALVRAFVAYLATTEHPGLVVDSWPDEENRITKDIEAVAGPFAIEHTSVDTMNQQRRGGAWFVQTVQPLQDRLKSLLQYHLLIIFPHDGISKGQDCPKIRRFVESWVLNESPTLPNGLRPVEIPGLPFRCYVEKDDDVVRVPGLFVGRTTPDDDSLSKRLSAQILRKADKLARYRKLGKITVLLVESDDVALMSRWKMLDALKKALPKGLPAQVNRIWFADTSIKLDPRFVEFTSELGLAEE
jgi:hypothetical protein